MVEVVSENRSTFAEDFIQQLSIIGKVLIKPIPSTFRSISDYPSIRVTTTIILSVIARLGVSTIELVKGNEFLSEWIIAIPLFLLTLAFTTGNMCKDFFGGQKNLFKQLFLAFVATYFTSIFINGVLISLTFLSDKFQILAPGLVLIYQIALTVMAVHAIANLNLWKSTFAVMISGVVTGLGIGVLVSTIGLIFFLMFERLF